MTKIAWPTGKDIKKTVKGGGKRKKQSKKEFLKW